VTGCAFINSVNFLPRMTTRRTAPRFRSPVWWPLAGILLLVLINIAYELAHKPGVFPEFLRVTWQDGHFFGMPVDIFNEGSRCLVLALGMTLVIATGGIDLSVGSVMAIAGSVAAVLLRQGDSLALVLGAALAVSLLCGLANGVLVAGARVQPIVATLILMVAGRGIAQLITNGDVIIIDRGSFAFLGNGFVLGVPFAPLLVALLYLGAGALLRRSALGLFIEALGDNETASRFAGLASARVKLCVYAACGFGAGVAGLLAASNIRAADSYRAGENMELDAIFAVVVGGTALSGGRFTLLGSFVGAVLLQTLTTTMYNLGVPPAVAPVPKAVLIITVCLFQSETTRRWLAARWRRPAPAPA